jgi:hypothetical protein
VRNNRSRCAESERAAAFAVTGRDARPSIDPHHLRPSLPDLWFIHDQAGQSQARSRYLRAIPPRIWALGFISLQMDISSEMIHAFLPIYLLTVMGAST